MRIVVVNSSIVRLSLCLALLLLAPIHGLSQDSSASSSQLPQRESSGLAVNWLYGAYVPKDVELKPLSDSERLRLYVRQTYTTWGIYAKTGVFAAADQASQSPAEWRDDGAGYAKRFGSRYGQFAIQNTFAATGNYLLGYEPRYDRCRCGGFWPRLGHALLRNFVTYNSTERAKRPQIALYAGALGAGMIGAAWKPGTTPWRSGYQSVLTQVVFGSAANVVGEFAPEITRKFRRK